MRSQVFVDVIGFTPLEAITCATRYGAELVGGGPLKDIAVLQDRSRLSVMKAAASSRGTYKEAFS